jgi:hypothetical protein
MYNTTLNSKFSLSLADHRRAESTLTDRIYVLQSDAGHQPAASPFTNTS